MRSCTPDVTEMPPVLDALDSDGSGSDQTPPKTRCANFNDTVPFEVVASNGIRRPRKVDGRGVRGITANTIPPPPLQSTDLFPARTPQHAITESTPLNVWQFPHVHSSRQLFPQRIQGRKAERSPDDKVVLLVAFSVKCFTTYHTSTPIDLDRYLPLLKYAREGAWHYLPSPEQLSRLAGLEENRLGPVSLTPAVGVTPTKQEIPWVHGDVALRTVETVSEAPCQNPAHDRMSAQRSEDGDTAILAAISSKRRSANSCRRCGQAKQRALQDCEIVYLSVVRTIGHVRGGYIPPPPVQPGQIEDAAGQTEVYKVIRSGSRDAATANAFYNAGAEGHSTVFTCAVRKDIDWSIVAEEGVRRVDELWQLTDDTNGPIPIFY